MLSSFLISHLRPKSWGEALALGVLCFMVETHTAGVSGSLICIHRVVSFPMHFNALDRTLNFIVFGNKEFFFSICEWDFFPIALQKKLQWKDIKNTNEKGGY